MDEADFDEQLQGTTKLITNLNINQEPISKPGQLIIINFYPTEVSPRKQPS